jgi:hypothetical protein
MENQIENRQICRFCIENEISNGGVLVEIFSDLINEPGKLNLSEKILKLLGLKVNNDKNLLTRMIFIFNYLSGFSK